MKRQLAYLMIGVSCMSVSCMSPSGAPDSDGWFMDASVVSGKEPTPPPKKLVKGEQVGAKFCTMDAEILKRVGMVDEVTRRALEKSSSKYIINAKFSSPSLSCIQVEGFEGK